MPENESQTQGILMMKKVLPLIIWIAVFQIIGYGIGLLMQGDIPSWYETLQKSSLNPPKIIFPIVWSCLYIMLAVAGWLLWNNRDHPRGKIIFGLYAIEMFMNWVWSPLFFQLHLIQLGFYWIAIMTFLTAIIIVMTKKINKLVCCLLLPYCLWLCFAGYLNWVIWIKN
jgi:translocator protein